MIRYYVDKSDVNDVIEEITRKQSRKNWFCNIAVKPYKGKKYDPENTVVIIVG